MDDCEKHSAVADSELVPAFLFDCITASANPLNAFLIPSKEDKSVWQPLLTPVIYQAPLYIKQPEQIMQVHVCCNGTVIQFIYAEYDIHSMETCFRLTINRYLHSFKPIFIHGST